MTLFCVKDGDNVISGPWNQPLKKVTPKPAEVPKKQYEKTSTPGVVIDTQTGKMETQLPDPTALAELAPVNLQDSPGQRKRPISWDHLPTKVRKFFFDRTESLTPFACWQFFDPETGCCYVKDLQDNWTVEETGLQIVPYKRVQVAPDRKTVQTFSNRVFEQYLKQHRNNY